MYLKLVQKRLIQKTAEATSDLIGNKIANKITRVLKSSQQTNSEIVTNEYDKEIPKERYMSPEERFKTSMSRSGLCDYSDAYILVKGTMSVENTGARGQPNNGANEKVTLLYSIY